MPDELLTRGDAHDFAEIMAHYILKAEEREQDKDKKTKAGGKGPRLRAPRRHR